MKTKKPATLIPLVPFSFIVTYFGDLAYGPKMQRMRGNRYSPETYVKLHSLKVGVKATNIHCL